MENQGWIKIHRKIFETSFYGKPLVVALFIHCLLRANHQDNKIIWNKEEMIIRRGSFVTGLKVLSAESGISTQSIRTALVTLKSTHTLTIKSTNKFSVITILNYEQYQSLTNNLTNEQQTTNKQLTTNNNDKNDNNVEKDTLGFFKEPEYLLNIPEEDQPMLGKNINVNKLDIKRKGEELYNWVMSSKKNRRENYKLVLKNALIKDFGYTYKS